MKKKTIMFRFSTCFILLMSTFACGGEQTVENSIESQLTEPETETDIISEDDIYDLIVTFPSPIEMAMVIKNGEYDFSSDMLLSASSLDQFTTSYDKAMAMGAYGADMAYLNIYNKIFLLPDYLVATRGLSKELDLDNFFDFETMMDLSENSDNIDSLIQMSTESFNEMESYLRDQGRDEISLLIVFGTWLEGATVIAQIANAAKDEELYDRIAEQKEFVHELYGRFEGSSDDYFNQLASNMKELEKLYEKIEIEEIIREPTIEEKDGVVTFIDNSEIIIHTSDDQIKSIIKKTIELRNELLN